jgi:hypothetical protein
MTALGALTDRSFRQDALAALFAAAAGGCGGYGDAVPSNAQPDMVPRYVSTDGKEFADGRADSKVRALNASGAHDLGCPPAQVNARVLATDQGKPWYVADGCGRRAVYVNALREGPQDKLPPFVYDCVLVSIVPLAPAPAP